MTPAPPTYYKHELDHYTLLISTSTQSAFIQRQQRVSFSKSGLALPEWSPFVCGEMSSAVLDSSSLIAVVNGNTARTSLASPNTDPPSLAFYVRDEFTAGASYEVFTAGKYNELKPIGEPRRTYLSGLVLLTHPYRIAYTPISPTEEALFELILIDVSLPALPQVVALRTGTEKVATSVSPGFRHRSIFENHFVWQTKNPEIGATYEMSWMAPDPEGIIDRLLAGHRDEIPDKLNFFSSFLREALLVEPAAVAQTYDKIGSTIASARSRIVVIDPYIDRSLLDLLDRANKEASIVLVSRSAAEAEITHVMRVAKARGFRIEVRTNDQIHDRFLILDDRRLLFLGSSLKDLGRRISTLVELEPGQTATLQVISTLYHATGLQKDK